MTPLWQSLRQMSKIKIVLVERGVPDIEALSEVCEMLTILRPDGDLEDAMRRYRPDVGVLDMPAPAPEFLQQLKTIQQNWPTPVVVFSQDDARETIELAAEAGVMAYVVDSLHVRRIVPILQAAMARFKHYRSLVDELDKTRTELADRKQIDRAKGIIMKQRGLTEDAAYRLMRDAAMAQNKKLADIAENIISAAELLQA